MAVAATTVFIFSLAGIGLLFVLKALEVRRGRVLAPTLRDRADDSALALKSRLWRIRAQTEAVIPIIAHVARYLVHKGALGFAALAHLAAAQAHRLADFVSHKHASAEPVPPRREATPAFSLREESDRPVSHPAPALDEVSEEVVRAIDDRGVRHVDGPAPVATDHHADPVPEVPSIAELRGRKSRAAKQPVPMQELVVPTHVPEPVSVEDPALITSDPAIMVPAALAPERVVPRGAKRLSARKITIPKSGSSKVARKRVQTSVSHRRGWREQKALGIERY